MAYLRYLYVFAYSGVKHIACCVFVLLSVSLDCPFLIATSVFSNVYLYSGTCAIRHLSFPTPCDIRRKFMVPKYFSYLK